MSTDRPPLDDLDLSAFLDDEADIDVSDRLAGDPVARERLEKLRTVSQAVAGAGVPPLPVESVDRLITAAMAASQEAGPGGTSPHEAAADDSTLSGRSTVVPVPITRSRRGVPAWLVAASVLALVGIGLALVWTGLNTSDTADNIAFNDVGASMSDQEASGADGSDAATAADRAEPDSAAAGAAEMAPEAGAISSTTGSFPDSTADTDTPTLVALGVFADPDALRVHLGESFPSEGVDSMPDTGITDDLNAAFRCLGKIDGPFASAGDPTDVGVAIVAGEPVVVYDMPYTTDDGIETTLVIAVDEATCTPVLTFQRT